MFRSQIWKYFFFGIAALAAIFSLVYTLTLTRHLRESERDRVKLWSEAYQEVEAIDIDQQISPIVLKIIESNNFIPVILVDQDENIISFANLDSNRAKDTSYLLRQLQKMKRQNEPIIIDLGGGIKHYLYYKNSKFLEELFYYPFVQVIVVSIFLLVIWVAAKSTKKAQEQMLWVAMSKETAHQIGTPLSSLVAWVEMMKLSEGDNKLIKEVEKDIKRLEKITERFSKIGSKPELEPTDLIEVINDVVTYLRNRSPKRIEYKVINHIKEPIIVNLSASLFEWVIENLAKNAIDAMGGKGVIEIRISQNDKYVIIDFKDQGKGIQPKYLKQIFQPGFSTKKYGWGMGLALVKRIIENYHNGKIFVLETSPKGTTFRIMLRKTGLKN